PVVGSVDRYPRVCSFPISSALMLRPHPNRLSDSCNKAMGQLAIGPPANCLNTMGLINVLTTPSGQSWVGPFDSYLTTTCSQPACPVEILSMTIDSLKEGCATDLAQKGWSADDLEKILGQGAKYYPS
ncbi:unnamed protein product, partial [Rhizoctonia solani]